MRQNFIKPTLGTLALLSILACGGLTGSNPLSCHNRRSGSTNTPVGGAATISWYAVDNIAYQDEIFHAQVIANTGSTFAPSDLTVSGVDASRITKPNGTTPTNVADVGVNLGQPTPLPAQDYTLTAQLPNQQPITLLFHVKAGTRPH